MACLGPAVLLCPCDGREVWHGDYESDGEIEAPHADDPFDQEGVPMRAMSSRLVTPLQEQEIAWAAGETAAAVATPSTPESKKVLEAAGTEKTQ